MKKNLFIKATNTVKNTLWSPSFKALSSIIITNGKNNNSSKETQKVKEQQIKLSRKSTKVDSSESSLSRISVKSPPKIKKNEMKTHKRILSLNNDLSLTNSELKVFVKKNNIVSPTRNKSIFYNSKNNSNNNCNTYNSNSSFLNKSTTNSTTRFNSINKKTKNLHNKNTLSLFQYRNGSKISRNKENNNKNNPGNLIIKDITKVSNSKSPNNNIKQNNISIERVNKIKFIQLFWKCNYFKKIVIPNVNLIIKHFRLYKQSKINLVNNKKQIQQNKPTQSSRLKGNICVHGIKTFPRLTTEIGNLRYQIQSYMIHKEKAKIKSILMNREIQITKENNLLFTTKDIRHIECEDIEDINNKKKLIFNREHPYINYRQIKTTPVFFPIKLVPLIPKNKTWQFQTKQIIKKENLIPNNFSHKEIIKHNCLIIYIVCVIKSHLWKKVLFKILDYIYVSLSCKSNFNEVYNLLNEYSKRRNHIKEQNNIQNISYEKELE